MSRILYSKQYDAKKGLKDPSNADHYVIVDANSGAEKNYLNKGWGNADGAPKNLQEAQEQDSKTPEEALAEYTKAAEDKLAAERAQEVAAHAKALAGGGVSAAPNDQSKALPVTETAGSEVIKTAAVDQTTPTPVTDALNATVADKAKEGEVLNTSFETTTATEADKAAATVVETPETTPAKTAEATAPAKDDKAAPVKAAEAPKK